MQNINKFTGMAEIYSKYRPDYSNEAIDYVISQTKLNEKNVVADIGSGTGKLTKSFLERGHKVYGIEPNENMRTKAEENLKVFNNFISINGSSDETTLSDKSIDLIVVAQAFHWFDAKKFLLECKRILRDNGYVAIIYNNGDYSKPIINEISNLSKKYCPLYKGSSGGLSNNKEIYDSFFTYYSTHIFNNNYSLNLEQFIGLNFSASYAPKNNDVNYETYMKSLIQIYNKYSTNGSLDIPNNTILRLGKVK